MRNHRKMRQYDDIVLFLCDRLSKLLSANHFPDEILDGRHLATGSGKLAEHFTIGIVSRNMTPFRVQLIGGDIYTLIEDHGRQGGEGGYLL